jgi:hypothetical protein
MPFRCFKKHAKSGVYPTVNLGMEVWETDLFSFAKLWVFHTILVCNLQESLELLLMPMGKDPWAKCAEFVFQKIRTSCWGIETWGRVLVFLDHRSICCPLPWFSCLSSKENWLVLSCLLVDGQR